MADGDKELVIRIRREVDPAGEAASRAAWAAERKQMSETAAAARAARKIEADAAKQAAAAAKQAEKEKADAAKQAARETAQVAKQAARESAQAARDAEREKAEAAKKSARDQVDAAKRQEKATRDAEAATRQMTRSLLGTQVAGAALNLVKSGIDAIARSSVEAKDRIRAMADEAAAARRADREVAALTGNKMTAGFAAGQAGQAAAAGVSPEAYRRAQLSFQAQAGQFIGDGDLAKISQADAADLLGKVSSFSASQGIDPADPARLMGTIIGKGGKGDSNDARMATFAKLFKAIQLAPGETSPLIGQLSELIQEEVGQGGTFEGVLDAAPLIRAMAERNPGEASTYGRSLIRGLREANMDPQKAQELGLTKGMSFMQQIGAVDKSAAAFGAAGGDEGEFLTKYFKDIREFGAVRTALNAGVRGKGFERVRAEMAAVDAGTVGSEISGYLGGEEGRAQTAESREVQARLEQGAGDQALREARIRARTSLTQSGDLNRGEGLGALFTNLSSFWQGDRAQQEETSLVGSELAQRLGGFAGGRSWMQQQGVTPGLNPFSLGTRGASESTLSEGFRVLAQLRAAAESLQRAGDAMQRPVPAPAPGRPPAFQGRP